MTYLPSGFGAGAGAEGLLWRWNGADLSQFRLGGAPELDTTGGAVLAISAYFGHPTIRATVGGAAGYAQWVIDPAEFPDGVPTRYVLEILYGEFDDGAGGKNPINFEMGFSHFCLYNAPGDVRAFTLAQSANGTFQTQILTRGLTFANSGSTPNGQNPGTGGDRGSMHRMVVTQDRQGAFDMFYSATFDGNAATADNQAGGSNLDFDAGAYDGLSPNTFGLALREFVGRPGAYCEIKSIRILSHPGEAA